MQDDEEEELIDLSVQSWRGGRRREIIGRQGIGREERREQQQPTANKKEEEEMQNDEKEEEEEEE